MPEENTPKVEEPAVEEPTIEESENLLTNLEKAGIKEGGGRNEDSDIKLQLDQLTQMLDRERNRNDELERRLSEKTYIPDSDNDDDTIDIEAIVEKGVEKALRKKEAQIQQVQQANAKMIQAIQQDEDYALVKNVWEKKLQNPNFIAQVQTGQVNLTDSYISTVRGYYKNLVSQAYGTINKLTGGKKQNITQPPHVETGGQSGQNIVNEGDLTEMQKYRKAMQEKVNSGYVMSEEESLSIVDSIFDAPPPRRRKRK